VACADFGLHLDSTFTSLAAYSSNLLLHPDRSARNRARDWYRQVIDFTAEAGAGSAGGHVGAFSTDDWRDPARKRQLWDELGESLAVLAAYARAQGLSALIGLGVAVDYSLLLVTRWREERTRGAANSDAVVTAMQTAGRAIAFSGLTVAVGLIALIVLPVPFLRSLGYGGILIPLVSVGVSLTLLPMLLATVGPRVDWPRRRRRHQRSRLWTGWARLVIRHRVAAALAALAVLGTLAAAAGLRVGDPAAASLAHGGPAYRGLVALQRSGIPTGVLTPIEVITPGGALPGGAVRSLNAVPGVAGVSTPSGPAWHRGGTSLTVVIPAAETSTPAGQHVIDQVRSGLRRAAPRADVGGEGAQTLDFVRAVYGSFPLMLALIALVTWLLLARAFRSVLLPVKAILLNLLSVGAICGALVLVWQDGHGSQAIWGIPATGAITDFVPLMTFAFLFGLSMDYEVFLLTRIREAHDAGASTTEAIVEVSAAPGASSLAQP